MHDNSIHYNGSPVSTSVLFKVALVASLISVLFNVINDCDETYNYWEPLHFLATDGDGGGFQTWEYSPSYGLRSYLYLWFFGWPAYLALRLGLSNWLPFILVRLQLAFLSALSTTWLIVVASSSFALYMKHRQLVFSLLLLCFSVLSPGYFLSSTTLVPSGPTSTITSLMLASWLSNHYFISVGCVAFVGLVLWPFGAALGIPLAISMLYSKKAVLLIKYSIFWAILWISMLITVDSIYFGRFVLAPLNIIKYNVFSQISPTQGSASQLYGTEPVSFYLKNYFLNHNISFLFASSLVCITPILLLKLLISKHKFSSNQTSKISISGMCLLSSLLLLLWNGIFFLQPHKEERFLFPCYPCLALASALCVIGLLELVTYITRHYFNSFITFVIVVSILFVFVILSFARILTLIRWYSAPMYLTMHLPPPSDQKPLLCLGRDWHYFPSRFLLPGGGKHWRVGFIKSNFSGQLPGSFVSIDQTGSVSGSTRRDGNRFNSDNREEPDRFVKNGPMQCDFILDRDSRPGQREELFIADQRHWVSVANRTVLEPSVCQTPKNSDHLSDSYLMCVFLRSFYVPFLSETKTAYVTMHILQRLTN